MDSGGDIAVEGLCQAGAGVSIAAPESSLQHSLELTHLVVVHLRGIDLHATDGGTFVARSILAPGREGVVGVAQCQPGRSIRGRLSGVDMLGRWEVALKVHCRSMKAVILLLACRCMLLQLAGLMSARPEIVLVSSRYKMVTRLV